jgi:hypothetical protein
MLEQLAWIQPSAAGRCIQYVAIRYAIKHLYCYMIGAHDILAQLV